MLFVDSLESNCFALTHLTATTDFNSVALLFNYRLPTADSQCRYGWKAGNRPVHPPEVEGAFTGW